MQAVLIWVNERSRSEMKCSSVGSVFVRCLLAASQLYFWCPPPSQQLLLRKCHVSIVPSRADITFLCAPGCEYFASQLWHESSHVTQKLSFFFIFFLVHCVVFEKNDWLFFFPFYHFILFICGGPCHLSGIKQCSGNLICLNSLCIRLWKT